MTTAQDAEVLADLLERLARLAGRSVRPQAAELQRRLRGRRFRVLVTGEAKRGKSTLINAMLSREILPAGVVPVTAVVTTVTRGVPERIDVSYRDGRHQEHPIADVADFVTEEANPGNRLGVDQVVVSLDAPALAEGLELVDTPGTGSVHAHNTHAAEQALASMDAAIFVLSVDPPISASEKELLVRVAEQSVRTFVVLNKIDRLDDAERGQAGAFVSAVIADAIGEDPRVYFCSARGALDARRSGTTPAASGLPAFESDFWRYLAEERIAALHRSVARRAQSLAADLLDGVRVTRRADAMHNSEAAEQVTQFQRYLDGVARRRTEAADLATAGVEHLLDELNTEAGRAEPELVAQVVETAGDLLGAELAGLPVDGLRRRGRELLADTVREVVDPWRDKQQQALEHGLRELEARLLAGLAEQLESVRKAAHELLDVDLAARADPSGLIENPRFFYLLTVDEDWSELVTDSIRRHLPGARRRAAVRLVADAERLTSKQVGRVRADLQYRLREAGRTLARAVADRYAAATDRLHEALVEAARMSAQSSEESERIRVSLAEREAALHEMLRDLALVATAPGRA